MARSSPLAPFRRFFQPRLLALIGSLALLLWSGWQWWSVGFDRQVTSNDVATREARVNTEKLEIVKTRLEKYQSPTTSAREPGNPFIAPIPDVVSSGG